MDLVVRDLAVEALGSPPAWLLSLDLDVEGPGVPSAWFLSLNMDVVALLKEETDSSGKCSEM